MPNSAPRKIRDKRLFSCQLVSALAASTVRGDMERDAERKISEYWKRLPAARPAKILLGDFNSRRLVDRMIMFLRKIKLMEDLRASFEPSGGQVRGNNRSLEAVVIYSHREWGKGRFCYIFAISLMHNSIACIILWLERLCKHFLFDRGF